MKTKKTRWVNVTHFARHVIDKKKCKTVFSSFFRLEFKQCSKITNIAFVRSGKELAYTVNVKHIDLLELITRKDLSENMRNRDFNRDIAQKVYEDFLKYGDSIPDTSDTAVYKPSQIEVNIKTIEERLRRLEIKKEKQNKFLEKYNKYKENNNIK